MFKRVLTRHFKIEAFNCVERWYFGMPKECRAAVGDDFPLMLDCYMALSVPYSITLARRLAQPDLHFTWMEEFLPPDAYEGYEEVMKAVGGLGLMLTTGEHDT